MTIKVGDKLPDGKLTESTEFDEAAGCPMHSAGRHRGRRRKGKKIAIFGLPGAYTPTCSAKHVPSYVKNFDKLKAKGVDEIWCVATNDAFVMAAWGRDQKAGGKVRMLGDGSGEWTKTLGLELDLTARGMGMRMQRFSMLVDNGVVKTAQRRGAGQVRGVRRRDDARQALEPQAAEVTEDTGKSGSNIQRRAGSRHAFLVSFLWCSLCPLWPLFLSSRRATPPSRSC